jgi:hypothetical protein
MATLQVGLNKQAIAIMQNHGIPIVDMYTAITKKCGPVPQAECFDSCECLCHQCPANHGLGYSWLADSTIVPVITKLLTDDDAAKMDDNPLKACPSEQVSTSVHTLQILGALDVAILGGTSLEARGDGIYVRGIWLTNHSRNILLSGVTTDSAWHNGLSAIPSLINPTVPRSTSKKHPQSQSGHQHSLCKLNVHSETTLIDHIPYTLRVHK